MTTNTTYPIVTPDNFDKLTKRLVVSVPFRGGRYLDRDYVLRVRCPKNRDEFYMMTKNMFGVGLTFTGYSQSYKIVEKYDDYSKSEIYKLWSKKYGQYDGLAILLNTVFGDLSCGGVSSSHYGSTKLRSKSGHRATKRLASLYSSKLSIHLPEKSNQLKCK